MVVFVLGHRGMLGQSVVRYLAEQGNEVLTSDLRYSGLPGDELIRAVANSRADWVINGIAALDSRSEDALQAANARLPAHLKACLRHGQRVLHPGTDGVFQDIGSARHRTDSPDATTPYGFSKLLGEAPAEQGKFYVLRTSIIGWNRYKPRKGLLGWFLHETGAVDGFVNQTWNGVTTLEWAKLAWGLISGDRCFPHPLCQAGFTPAISKFELLGLIRKIWGRGPAIRPSQGAVEITRTLVPDLMSRDIRTQLAELRAWHARAD